MEIQVGDRVGFFDRGQISLGTVIERDLIRGVRMNWDDGFEDTEDDGWWFWPNPDLKRVKS